MSLKNNLPHWKMSSPDPDAPPHTLCAVKGCEAFAGYKAPKKRDSESGYHWLCLKHVRQYNAQWNFFKGMRSEEIQAAEHETYYWNRPTWERSATLNKFSAPKMAEDILKFRAKAGNPKRSKAPKEILSALKRLDLDWPVTREALQKQYRFYAKKFHPDHNPQDKMAEKSFKEINQAYQEIKNFLDKKE